MNRRPLQSENRVGTVYPPNVTHGQTMKPFPRPILLHHLMIVIVACTWFVAPVYGADLKDVIATLEQGYNSLADLQADFSPADGHCLDETGRARQRNAFHKEIDRQLRHVPF